MALSFKKIFPFTAAVLLLTACGGGGGTAGPFTNAEKAFVKNLFLNEYLWYDEVNDALDPQSYTTPQSLINAFRVTPPDKWSFSITKQAYADYSNQKTSGFGFGYQTDFRIFVVLIDSPAYGKLKRGDIILKINGEDVSITTIKAASQALNTATSFTVNRNGQETTVSVTPREYTHKVAMHKIIQHAGMSIGYLRYGAFTSSSVDEIEEAFSDFHQQGIDDLVIDLRYNGGGSVSTASTLLNNITNAYPGQRQLYLDWNDQYQSHNAPYFFESTQNQDHNELAMQRVFFLTTKHSASASELVINALKPYLGESNVITIGDATHGKPVGMSGKVFGSKGENYYFLINFVVRNDDCDTSSFDGISPTCQAADDVTHEMGDPTESMFATALHYAEHNQCPATAQQKMKKTLMGESSIADTPLKLQGVWTTPSLAHD
jgi:C-terminal processing protease CtpA/Prc